MDHEHDHGGAFKHGLMMLLCCLLPILIIGALPLLGLNGSAFTFLIFLLCPLMHVGMMLMMGKNKKNGSCHEAGSSGAQPEDNE